jgi:26S proteasome regulatory subunit N8
MTSMQIDEDDVPAVETTLSGNIKEVTMHPLVLLSAADHYHRVARGTRKGIVDCTNSFAVPFEEDSKNAVSFAV